MEANTQLERRYKMLLTAVNKNHSLTGTVLYTQDTNVFLLQSVMYYGTVNRVLW
jgi:hypothetical protein